MITIAQEGTQVKVSIEHGLNTGSTTGATALNFYFECSNRMYAELLVNQLKGELGSRIEHIRRDEYDRGWAQGRKLKASQKERWFSKTFKLWN